MILSCPECSTRYVIDPAALGPSGRTVRCTRCSHSWAEPPPAVEELVAAQAVSPPVSPPIDFSRGARPRGTNLPALPGEKRSRAPAVLWTILLLFLIGVAGVAAWQRDAVITRLPAAAELYELVGLGPVLPGTGLALENVRQKVSTRDGARILRIDGDIVNVSGKPRDVPQMLGVLLDGAGKEIKRWEFQPPLPKLLHHERAPFSTELADPPDAASEVRVTFGGSLVGAVNSQKSK
jgi:predicted Zn finger-like uncharacterized protein